MMAKKYVYLFSEKSSSGRSDFGLQIDQVLVFDARSESDQIIELSEVSAVCDCAENERSVYDGKNKRVSRFEELKELFMNLLREIVMRKLEVTFNQTSSDNHVPGEENEWLCYFYQRRRSKRIIPIRQPERVRERHRCGLPNCSLKIA